MGEKLVFTPTIIEGDAGCVAKIEELGIQVGTPTRDLTVHGLKTLLHDHCTVLVNRGDTSRATHAQMELAKQVVANGFELRT